MNSLQRVLCALSHREADRVPLFLLANLHGAAELGLPIQAYYSRAEHVVEGQMRLLVRYGSDCLYGFCHAAMEHEAWGGEVIFSDDGPPNAGAPVLRAAQIDRLEPPQVADCPGLLRVLRLQSGLKARVGDTVPIIGVVVAPFSLPVMQMGFDAYLELMHDEPQRLQRLLQVNEAFAVAWANAQLSAGATAICWFDPVSSSTIVPRELYLRTGFESARRCIARIQGPVAAHLASGRCAAILDDLAATGAVALGVSALEDLAALKAGAAGRISLLGNLNGIEMRRWTPDEAQAAVRRAIAGAAAGGGFILSDNHGEIPLQVAPEVLLAIADAVRRWGAYPLRHGPAAAEA